MPEGVLAEISHICARHNIELGFVPELFGLTAAPEPEALTKAQAAFEASLVVEPPLTLPAYFKASRACAERRCATSFCIMVLMFSRITRMAASRAPNSSALPCGISPSN
jgi:hypothetical protein